MSLCFKAVIGAGIGGTATAHFLRQHFGPEVRIDVFEKQEVGGRLATVTVNSQAYETGGSIIHSLNLHMQDFMKQLGLYLTHTVNSSHLPLFCHLFSYCKIITNNNC